MVKGKTDLENKKTFKVNPYLAAGIPLTLASALSLRASIPAARMGVKSILKNRSNRNYHPSAFVNDYLESAYNIGKSPVNKVMKYLEVNSRKSPVERLDEAAHWDEFTRNKTDGMNRWLYELDRNLQHAPKKQEAFRGKVNRFREVIQNNPDKLHLAENDPVASQVLRRMATHNEPWAKKFGLLGIGNTGLFGAGVGLTGKGTYDELKKTSSVFAQQEDPDGLTVEEAAKLGLGGVGAGVGVKKLIDASKLMGSNTIGVTAGKIDAPIFDSSTGMGHISPAEAQYEALLRHPAVQSGEFNLDKLIRMNDKFPDELRGKNPSKNWLVTLENGFGATVRKSHKDIKKSPIYHNPYGQAVFLPDPPPKDSGFFLQHPEKNKGILDWIIRNTKLDKYKPVRDMSDTAGKIDSKIRSMVGSNRELITFGPDYHGHHPEYDRLINIPNAHPALADSTLAAAQKGLSSAPLDNKAVLNSLIAHAKDSKDFHTAKVLEEALKGNKKILSISGASRGDQVGGKALETYNYLKKKKRLKDYVILALMGEGKGDLRAGQISNLPGVASFGKLNRENYIAAQNLGKAHWGNTGASSFAEARTNTTPTAFSVNNAKEKAREIKRLKRMGAPEELITALEKIDLDSWNKGTINDILGMPDRGVKGFGGVRSAREFVRFADEAGRISPDVMKSQARGYLNDALEGKKLVADKIIDKARRARGASLRAGSIKNIAGGALIGGGALLGLDALHKKMQRRKKSKEKSS